MNIIRLMGGLGNQMFQFALYRALQQKGKDVKIDDVTGYTNDRKRVPALEKTFGITYERASEEETAGYLDLHRDFASRLRRRLLGYRARIFPEPADGNYDPAVAEQDNVYLNGYWQTERYFSDPDVRQRLRQDFTLDPAQVITKQPVWETLAQIRNTESVSIHIRRGDYIEPEFAVVYGDICTEAYYVRAVDYILEREPRAVFYLFSDDREWTKKHFDGERFVVAGGDDVLSDTEDMLLMSQCKHNIIANSSFSWWASWLNGNEKKMVVAPEKWLNTKDIRDIYTDRMVRL
ncbi:MAG: alpha-1,2-fucosyltransferase [Lachnospiraceae bacterium]|nr:alpha-1,2-fucosyltransferase [Lachnospiraceae bacterium]